MSSITGGATQALCPSPRSLTQLANSARTMSSYLPPDGGTPQEKVIGDGARLLAGGQTHAPGSER